MDDAPDELDVVLAGRDVTPTTDDDTPRSFGDRRLPWWGHCLVALLLIGGLSVAVFSSRTYVEANATQQTRPPAVVLVDAPAWMSDSLARQIVATITPSRTHSVFDHDYLVQTAERLRANPWVATVRSVTRSATRSAGDTVEISADYRTPAALVKSGDRYLLIDDRGVRLPETYEHAQLDRARHGPTGQINLRIIDGLAADPPEPGKAWRGDDLQAGLAMVKLVFGQPFAGDIAGVDVSNYARRKNPTEAQLVLVTQYRTQIRWGRSPNASDFFIEVPPEQKLASLSQIYSKYGRVDAHQPWLDIRFDKITYPSPDTAPQARLDP